jgi:hypothetical protein
VDIKAPHSALQPPDIKASSFTPLRSLFVIKTASVNQNTKEELRARSVRPDTSAKVDGNGLKPVSGLTGLYRKQKTALGRNQQDEKQFATEDWS